MVVYIYIFFEGKVYIYIDLHQIILHTIYVND
jgi:hypothetical protein